jgi:transcriptional regulator with XRE-family HTH domain
MDAAALVDALKRILKAKGLTYADIARGLDLSEASVKRIFSRREFTLERLDEVCGIAGVDFAELARAASEQAAASQQLTAEQEQEIVSDPKLLLVALCAVNNWTFDEIVATYDLSAAEATQCLARLDRHRIIELGPGNRIRPLISRAFAWRPGGPIQRFFQARIQDEYLASAFDGPGEMFVFVSGMLSHASRAELIARLRRVARDFTAQHADDVALPLSRRFGTSLLVAMRPWEPRAFRTLRHASDKRPASGRFLAIHEGGASGSTRRHRK